MLQHKQLKDRLGIVRDVIAMRLEEAQEGVHTAMHRRTVVQEALRLQSRMDSTRVDSTVKTNYTTTIRITGHLYNRHLLERTLDVIEANSATVRSVGEPVLGGMRNIESTIVLQLSGVGEEKHMKHILEQIIDIFEKDKQQELLDNGGKETQSQEQSVVILEEAKDVGEMGKLVKQLKVTSPELFSSIGPHLYPFLLATALLRDDVSRASRAWQSSSRSS